MGKDHKTKTLTYRRAVFMSEADQIQSLEKYLIQAHQKRPSIELRTFTTPGHPTVECRNFFDSGKGIFLHLASYNPGEKASILKKLRGVNTGDIDTASPPDGTEFMDGDLMVFVIDNHVFLCATNIHEKKAETYMINIIESAKCPSEASKFGLSKVGDIDKLKVLQKQGVKAVHLDASIYDATIAHSERTTLSSRLSGGFMDQLRALIKKDMPDIEIEKAENLIAHIVLTYDSRKKKVSIGRSALENMAKQMVDDNEEGFMIETLGGEKIRQDQITVRKKVKLPGYGKSVLRQDAWRALQEYHLELQAGGILEQ